MRDSAEIKANTQPTQTPSLNRKRQIMIGLPIIIGHVVVVCLVLLLLEQLGLNTISIIAVLAAGLLGGAIAYAVQRQIQDEVVNLQQRSEEVDEIKVQLTSQVREAAMLEERNRLARELHDSIKQQIFTINVGAAAAQTRFDHDQEGAKAALVDVRNSAKEAMAEMNALLQQLSPKPLETVGLIQAIRDQGEALGYRTGASISTEFDVLPPNARLPLGTHESLFRITQEVLANISRHARANHVRIELGSQRRADVESLLLEISDDGCGFDELTVQKGMGLRNIKARAEALNGQFELTSIPDRGSTVRVWIPLVGDGSTTSHSAEWINPSKRLPNIIRGSEHMSLFERPANNQQVEEEQPIVISSLLNVDVFFGGIWAFVIADMTPMGWMIGTIIFTLLCVFKFTSIRNIMAQRPLVDGPQIIHRIETHLLLHKMLRHSAILFGFWGLQWFMHSAESPPTQAIALGIFAISIPMLALALREAYRLRGKRYGAMAIEDLRRFLPRVISEWQIVVLGFIVMLVLTYFMRQYLAFPAITGLEWLVAIYITWTTARLLDHIGIVWQARMWQQSVGTPND